MKYLSCLFILFLHFTSGAQVKKFISNLDTNLTCKNAYIDQYDDYEAFFSSGVSDMELNPYDVDQDLLNATVFFMMNKVRKKRHRSKFDHCKGLALISHNFIKQFSVFKFRRLKNNNARVSKILPMAFREVHIKKGLSRGIVEMPYLVDYKWGKSFHYDEDDTETDLKMYYGTDVDPEEGEVKTPIPMHTYTSFADRLVNNMFVGFTSRYMRSKSYSMAACYVEVDQKSIHKKHKIPRARAIILLSGKRVAMIK